MDNYQYLFQKNLVLKKFFTTREVNSDEKTCIFYCNLSNFDFCGRC